VRKITDSSVLQNGAGCLTCILQSHDSVAVLSLSYLFGHYLPMLYMLYYLYSGYMMCCPGWRWVLMPLPLYWE